MPGHLYAANSIIITIFLSNSLYCYSSGHNAIINYIHRQVILTKNFISEKGAFQSTGSNEEVLGPKGHRTSPCGDESKLSPQKPPCPRSVTSAQGLQALPGLAVQLLHARGGLVAGREDVSCWCHGAPIVHAQLALDVQVGDSCEIKRKQGIRDRGSQLCIVLSLGWKGEQEGPGHSGNPVRCID